MARILAPLGRGSGTGLARMQAAIPLGGGDVRGLDVGAGELHGGDRHLPPRGRGHPRLRSRRARSHFTDPPPRLAPSAAWTAAAAAARRLIWGLLNLRWFVGPGELGDTRAP